MRAVRVGLASAAAIMLGGSASPPVAVDLPSDTLLVLVAPWCASCWGELARLDELAAAAAPLTIRVLVRDEGARARARIADLPAERRWAPAAKDRSAVRAALWARTLIASKSEGAVVPRLTRKDDE